MPRERNWVVWPKVLTGQTYIVSIIVRIGFSASCTVQPNRNRKGCVVGRFKLTGFLKIRKVAKGRNQATNVILSYCVQVMKKSCNNMTELLKSNRMKTIDKYHLIQISTKYTHNIYNEWQEYLLVPQTYLVTVFR